MARRGRNPQSIVIIGRRWFNRGPGNTYFSSEIIVDGKHVEGIDFAYGYGEHFLWESMKKLAHMGLVTWTDAEGAPTRWARDNGVALSVSAIDVSRRKDLGGFGGCSCG